VGGVGSDLRLRIKVARDGEIYGVCKLVFSFRGGQFGGSNGGGLGGAGFGLCGECLASVAEKREGFDGVFGLRGLIIEW
jgi:hypothetical protein